ncbi:MAG: HNH endonuclease [Burkholderiales bacterium]
MELLVLTVDMAGLPQAWVALEEAITYHAKQMVAVWSLGREVREFRGGWQRNGERSRIATKSILAIKARAGGAHPCAEPHQLHALRARPPAVRLLRQALPGARPVARSRRPGLRGGRDSWTNTVTARRSCNTGKGGRSPEQAGMPLPYVPYVPNRHRALHPAQTVASSPTRWRHFRRWRPPHEPSHGPHGLRAFDGTGGLPAV